MQINELQVNKKSDRKRVGRGGKRGTYSGRGMKGQGARSGGKKDPLFEGGRSSLIQRLKKVRGFKSVKPEKNIFKISDLEKNFKDGEIVTIESLVGVKLLRKKFAKNGVKILGEGELTKKITVADDVLVSKSAREIIEKAGGKIEEESK